MSDSNRVIVVGGGPVGMITGLALASEGIPVTVLERLAEIPTDHRASTLHPSTLAMLEPLGMTGEALRRGLRSPHFQFRDRATGEVVAEFDYALLADETPFPFALQLEQHKTIGIAEARARGFDRFELRRGHEVAGMRQTADRVEVEIALPDGSTEFLAGRYLIGCDGGRSAVRKAAGIDFPGFTWEERFIIVSTRFDFGAADGYCYRNYIAHPEQWCAIIKVPGERDEGVWRALFPAFTDQPDEEVLADEWIQARFAECLPYDPPYAIEHRNLYAIHQRVAASFRCGRAMLAGDAAHVNNPVGGMGMNSGIHDGINLAGKLAAIWRGEGDDDLLDLYDRQRRPMAEKYVQAQSIRNKEMLGERDPEIRRRRFEELRRTAGDRGAARAYLRRSSLIAMVDEANAIT
ncbi:MAG: FAD-dependent monooxygenase [Defluviicoccus sp.]|nr:FAD-dependent monooxygenase [Defluviicoccus sp.]MDE0383919.1 FAD-dependent monooxygenase [Defluviicoccus sp.]